MTDSTDGTYTTEQHSLLVRAVWFVLVGWWATGIWLGVAWLLNVTIIGLPLGIKMINYVPTVQTLKHRTDTYVTVDGRVEAHGPKQTNLFVRAVYFLLIGWWFSGIWMTVSWLVSLTIVGLPISIWMTNKLPYVVSLYRLSE
ncbi:MAG: YccF domain-containing protein [Halapricum sp.]